jgi:DNA-binding response OmpR family regulator
LDRIKRVAGMVIASGEVPLRHDLARHLCNLGHQVIETSDGARSLELVRAHRPAILVLDLELPGLTGFEVLDALRYDPAAARLIIVVLAKHGDAETRLDTFEAGATEFLLSSHPPAELASRIHELLDPPSSPPADTPD